MSSDQEHRPSVATLKQLVAAGRLPGDDFSSLPWQGEVDSVLVLDFAKRMVKAGAEDFPKDLSQLSSAEILQTLRIDGKMAAGILFGDFSVRIGYYDKDDKLASNVEKKGLYSILRDDFIEQIQSSSEKKGGTVEGNSTFLKEYRPYPPELLREILANSVAHSLYQRWQGEIIVDIHLNRVTVRNNAPLEAEAFAGQWFSKNAMVKNKLLMTTLRAAKITDEMGSGRAKIFRLAIEAGKEEPIVEFIKLKNFAKWHTTVCNSQRHEHIDNLLQELASLPTPDHSRIALAMVLWREHSWSSITARLDTYYQRIADEVVKHSDSPVVIADDKILVKSWADAALAGKTSAK